MKLSIETFVAVVRKSGLIDNERLQRALLEFTPSGGVNETAVQLADRLIAANLLTRWQADKLLQGKHRGYFLGKYKLLSLLGKGGMSSVYLAEHLLMRRQCALKVLPAKRVGDSSYLERFHREAQAAASLDHPNIVRAYDVDHQQDGNRQIHFLVMEYVEGSSLQDLVPEKGMTSFLDAAEYARQAALGLQHAHENGMVHRDIKPGNLLVDPNGVVKILDLGLARFFKVDEGSEALTLRHDEKVLGTADYLAPEQALDSHSVDSRADLYSLGCTLYFMVTGQPPFIEGTLAQRLLAHQVKTPPTVESLRPDIPISLAVIIRKMMEKRPADRYATAADLENALFNWIDENADNEWRKAHFNVYGSRAADSEVGTETLPVAKPVDSVPVHTPTLPPRVSANNASPVTHSETTAPKPGVLELSDPSTVATNDTSLNLFLSTLTQPKSEAVLPPAIVNPPPEPMIQIGPQNEPVVPKPPAAAPSTIVTSSPNRPATNPRDRSNANQVIVNSPPVVSVKKSSTTVRRLPASANKKISKNLLFGIVPIAILIAIGIYISGSVSGLFVSSSKNRSNLAPFPLDKLEVSVGGISGEYRNIRDALIAVRDRYRPGSQNTNGITIKVAPGIYRERIRIDGRTQPWPEGIRLVGAGDVRLAPTGDGPVLRLANVSRFSIENIRIDASDQNVAVELADDLHETRLTQMVISGFSDTGILCKGAQGLSFANNQLALDRIKFVPARPQAEGIRLEPGSENEVNNIAIRHCSFLQSMTTGINLRGRAPYGIEISHCVFNEIGDAIRFEGEQQLKLIRITNNSFRKAKRGIIFSAFPGELSGELVLRRNLFIETGIAEAVIQPNFDEAKFRSMISASPNGIQDNWSDRAKPAKVVDGEITILFENQGHQGEQNLSLASTDPKDPKFLAPTEKSPQKDVAGAQPNDSNWIGAIGP